MDTPMPSNSALTDALKCIKPEIRALAGYTAPPQGKVIAKLNQNENAYDIPAEWKNAVCDAMKQLEWPRYPQYSPQSLREKLGERLHVEPDQILLGHGSNQLLYLLGTALLSPGSRVVIPPPTFSLFELAMKLSQSEVVLIPKNDDFSLNMEAVIPAVRSARLTLLCSPDNPTGAVIPGAALKEILENTPGIVLWDEAYIEFGGQDAVDLLDKYPNLIVSRTFSKAFGLAGLRLGYLVGHPAMIRELQKANIPYNVNLFTLTLANYMLDHTDWMDRHVQKIISDRQNLFDQMKKIEHIKPYPSEGNFILFQVRDKKSVFTQLKERGILIRDVGSQPPLDHCLRVTVGTPEENGVFLEALKQLTF